MEALQGGREVGKVIARHTKRPGSKLRSASKQRGSLLLGFSQKHWTMAITGIHLKLPIKPLELLSHGLACARGLGELGELGTRVPQ